MAETRITDHVSFSDKSAEWVKIVAGKFDVNGENIYSLWSI